MTEAVPVQGEIRRLARSSIGYTTGEFTKTGICSPLDWTSLWNTARSATLTVTEDYGFYVWSNSNWNVLCGGHYVKPAMSEQAGLESPIRMSIVTKRTSGSSHFIVGLASANHVLTSGGYYVPRAIIAFSLSNAKFYINVSDNEYGDDNDVWMWVSQTSTNNMINLASTPTISNFAIGDWNRIDIQAVVAPHPSTTFVRATLAINGRTATNAALVAKDTSNNLIKEFSTYGVVPFVYKAELVSIGTKFISVMAN